MIEAKRIVGDYFTIPQLAAELGVSLGTIYRWNRLKIGPRKLKLGHRRIVYKVEDVRRWIDEGGQK